MVAILMICHGNICRSTMAEYVMRHLVMARGMDGRVKVDSAATTRDALGWGVHEGTQRKLRAEGIAYGNHRARQMTRADYDRYDLICGMDQENLGDIYRILAGKPQRRWGWQPVGKAEAAEADPAGKVHLLLDWAPAPRDIADPWYTDDFDATYRDVLEGCTTLLDRIESGEAW